MMIILIFIDLIYHILHVFIFSSATPYTLLQGLHDLHTPNMNTSLQGNHLSYPKEQYPGNHINPPPSQSTDRYPTFTLYLCSYQDILMSILQRIASYEYEQLYSFHEACIHYFSGLYLGMEVEDLPSEMISILHQSEKFSLWVDCGSVSERMTVESMKEILRLSVQQAKEELLKYCITRDSSYLDIIIIINNHH